MLSCGILSALKKKTNEKKKTKLAFLNIQDGGTTSFSVWKVMGGAGWHRNVSRSRHLSVRGPFVGPVAAFSPSDTNNCGRFQLHKLCEAPSEGAQPHSCRDY